MQRVGKLIRADRRITLDSVATARGCSHGLEYSYSIMHDRLKSRKVCARWVPRELKDREKMKRRCLFLQHLSRYTDEGEDMLNRIVTGDESWVDHYQPGSKSASMQWKHPSSVSSSTKKFKFRSTPSAGKVLLTVFWDSQGVRLAHFQKRDESVNSASYCEVLLKPRDAICRKRPGQQARGLLLHHDSARPHTAQATQERI
jgi:hypothetical protein